VWRSGSLVAIMRSVKFPAVASCRADMVMVAFAD
jgi:hypothetical protein